MIQISNSARQRLGPVAAVVLALSTLGLSHASASVEMSSAPAAHAPTQVQIAEPQNLFQRLVRMFFPPIAVTKPKAVIVPVLQPVSITFDQLDPRDIEAAIHASSQLTGVPESYLIKTAWKESSFNPKAEAKTSSASGLYQMIDDTWLELMKRYGAKYGLEAEADKIIRTGDGDLWVAGRDQREYIMDLRFDPRVSALLAGELAAENQRILTAGLGRSVGDTDLYIAHFIGPRNAVKLIAASERSPGSTAANLFPKAARANEAIFYTPGGSPRSAAAVVRRLALK